MSRKLVGGFHRTLRRLPIVFAFLGALMLAGFSFYSSNRLHSRQGQVLRVTDTHGLSQIYEPETVKFPATKRYPATLPELPTAVPVSSGDSERSLRELVRDAVDRGLVVIVNGTDTDARNIIADHSQGARLDISSALDGPTGEILTEVIEELQQMEEMKLEVAELKLKLKGYKGEGRKKDCPDLHSKTAEMTPVMAPRQGDYKFRVSGRPLHPLMSFSAFRFGLDEFTAVGLAAPSLLPPSFFEAQEDSCSWVEWDAASETGFSSPMERKKDGRGVQYGQKRTILLKDGDSPYVVIVVKCKFGDPAGSNGYGGHLFMNSSAGEYIPLLSEPPESIDKIQFEGPLDRRFAVCTPPIWGKLNADHLKEWLVYHHHLLGSERIHYFFYAGVALDEPTRRVLQPLLDQHMATVVDLSADMDLVGGPSQFPSTHLSRNDCVQRSRFFADWAVLWDFHEFLQTFSPHHLLDVVRDNSDKPFIAFGNQRWSSAYCATADNTTDQWTTDRMIFRLALPNCGNRNHPAPCPGGEGERRHIVSPRKVYAVHHQFVMDPPWGGADVSTEQARVNQFLGTFVSSKPGEEVCTIVKDPGDVNSTIPVDGYWFKDTSFASSLAPAKASARSSSFWKKRGAGGYQEQNSTADIR